VKGTWKDMRPHHPRRLVIAFAVLLGLSLLVACNGGGDEGASVDNAGTAQDSAPGSSKEMAEQVIGGLFESFKSYTSFEEAEQVAGYHILRPSSEYPVAYGLTYLQWSPRNRERPLSETNYTYPSIAPGGIRVNVVPSYFYPEGDKTATSGKPLTVGGKAGWLDEEHINWVFVFDCGSVDDVKLWCQVTAGKEIGWEAFDHFVSTLQ
jgi:hypothetical protein